MVRSRSRHVHVGPQVRHRAAVAAGDELPDGREDGVQDVDAVDGQQVAADGALEEVLVARAGKVVLPHAARRVHVDAMDGAQAAGGDGRLDRAQRWRDAGL